MPPPGRGKAFWGPLIGPGVLTSAGQVGVAQAPADEQADAPQQQNSRDEQPHRALGSTLIHC